MPSAQKLPVDTQASATEMADAIFGTGVTVVSASYTGANAASGIYSNGDTVADAITPSDTGVILSTGKATSITNSKGDVNSKSYTSSNNKQAGDDDLSEIAGSKTYDASILEAEFVPQGSTLTMQVTFSSEEYLEYCNSGFNDAVGVWVNGQMAELTVGDGEITINNINDTSNENLYIDNSAKDDLYNTEMDGFTVTLTLKAPVMPGQVNTLKIAIADGGDAAYDSNLLIAGESVQTALVAGSDEVEIVGGAEETVDVLANDSSAMGGQLTITHINGHEVVAGDSVTLSSGEVITLNPDGTFGIDSDGEEGENTFSYTVADEFGNIDTAFVTVTTTPCFVAGTLIDTVMGRIPVEQLDAGDLVITKDHGPRPVRWIGRSFRPAAGVHAPVRFATGALGGHFEVLVSPNHRVLVKSVRALLLFGKEEVLVPAKHLLNDHSIRRVTDGRQVMYVHLLFDAHEVITANGMQSESYHPGDQTVASFDADSRAEVLELMPGLDQPGFGYGPTARPVLRGYELRALRPPA